jgi:hypothetical protein
MKSLAASVKKRNVDKAAEVWQIIRENPEVLAQIKLIIKKGGK